MTIGYQSPAGNAMPVRPDEFGPYRFALETLEGCLDEVKPLHAAHWAETEMYRHGLEMNPDYPRVIRSEQAGFFRQYTMRVKETGELVGACGLYLMPSTHTQKLVAQEDSIFVKEEHRGRAAMAFIRYMEDCLWDAGAMEIRMHSKTTNRVGKLLEFIGFSHVANLYVKVRSCP
ncbi:hypothetical protein PTW32_10855 [Dechloromonas agitata]|uniref:GNAT family N-acetyltransferase n=1 Tax=Dechloromonas agitata TaxID=73030 RepID=UPI00237E7441|nr:GNAT family N-acetyltransferase [Dechloromonas agitata]MDE1545919.1 hypothetical protein [Dechloromonas agitata]